MKCAIGGCNGAPTTLLVVDANVNPNVVDASIGRLAIDASNLYWTDGKRGTVTKLPLAGGAPAVLATGQIEPRGIVSDGANAYWVDKGDGDNDIVMKCSIEGCDQQPTQLTFGDGRPGALAVDATSLYWSSPEDGTIVKLTPK